MNEWSGRGCNATTRLARKIPTVLAVTLAAAHLASVTPARAQSCGEQATPDNTTVCAPCDNRFSVAVNGEGDQVQAAPAPESNMRYLYRRDVAHPHETMMTAEDRFDLHSSPEALIVQGGVHGDKSLYFHGSSAGGDANDRFEIDLSQSGGSRSSVLEIGEWRYLRFFIKVDSNSGLINGQPYTAGTGLVMQVWQRSSSTVGPPFAIALDRTQDPIYPFNARFFYRNEYVNDEQACRVGGSGSITFFTRKLPANQWIGFVIAFKPSYVPHTAAELANGPGRGTILVWVTQKAGSTGWVSACAKGYQVSSADGLGAVPGIAPYRVEDACNTANESDYRFYWGYRPKQSAGMESKFDIRVGSYRNAGVPVSFWLDSIKLTNDESLLPGLGESRDTFTCPEWPGPFTCPN